MSSMNDVAASQSGRALRSIRWGVPALLLLCASTVAQAQSGCTPSALPNGAQGMDLCYGTAAWREPTLNGIWLQQRFDFYRVPGASGTAPVPVVVWAHPNGGSKSIAQGSPAWNALVKPALDAGFSFASIEFRHPVVNEIEADSPTNPGVPHYDIARALQFIRANAYALGIDRRNVFVVGGSRGTLSLWTVLQDDMAIPNSPDPVARQSTRANAAFAFNAQTSYDGNETADLFLVEQDRAAYKAAWRQKHPKYAQFGSSVSSASANDPPVFLRYDQTFVGRLVTLQELLAMDEVHYPDFGLALCAAYDLKGIGDRCHAEGGPQHDGMPQSYAGYIDFFRRHLRSREQPVLPADPVAPTASSKRALPPATSLPMSVPNRSTRSR